MTLFTNNEFLNHNDYIRRLLLLVNSLYQLIQNVYMDTLYQEVQHIFKDFSTIKQQLESAFRYIRYYYPSYHIPKIATFITGMGSDIYADDSLIVIGLDFFLGQGAKFRPHLPQYILKNYQPAYVVPKVMFGISQQFNAMNSDDGTLLADMIDYGKSCYFTQSVMPYTADSLIIGYTAQQLAAAQQNQSIIWEHFILHKLLYETNHLVIDKYISERPFTLEIGQECPGRIGIWLGWAIVKKYMALHQFMSLPDLMHNADAQSIFMQSKYRPTR